MEKETADLDSIVRAVLDGDLDRYEEIMSLLQQDVWRVVAMARFDSVRAREVVHQTFVQGYLNLKQYRLGTNFKYWIKAIARNLVRQEFRTLERRGRHLQVYEEHVQTFMDDDEKMSQYENEWIPTLRKCMDKLPENCRTVINLRYERSLTLNQLSQRLGRTVDAVKQMLWRGRVMLRDCIQTKAASNA